MYYNNILTTKNALDTIVVTDKNDYPTIFTGYTAIATCSRTLLEDGFSSIAIELYPADAISIEDTEKND